MRFDVVFAAAVESHLRVLTAAERARVPNAIEGHLIRLGLVVVPPD